MKRIKRMVEFVKPKLEVRAYYEWEEVENWLDSSFNDSMYVVDDLKTMIFKLKGFNYISLEDEFIHEDKRVIAVYKHMLKHLSINDEGFWVLV